MALPPTRRVSAALGATVLVLTASLAGCSITRDDQEGASSRTSEPSETPSDESSPTATTSSSGSPSASPSATTSPSASASAAATATESVVPSRAPTLGAALLSAKQMPQLNDEARWTVRRTGPVSSKPFGVCQKFDMLSIGAVSAVERTFVFDDSSAGQQVADFPDRATALRATKVFEAWHRDCAKRVSKPGLSVGSDHAGDRVARPGMDLPRPLGQGGTGQFHVFGLAVSDNRMSVVRIDHPGQDHNYERGKEPAELAVKAVAARLG